ncbi:MAG: hypothetical protein ACTSP4_15090 [Candidatus Hodarchaeales archaeon]
MNQITEPLKEIKIISRKAETSEDLLKWLLKQKGKRATRDLEIRVLKKLVPAIESEIVASDYERLTNDLEELVSSFTAFDRLCRKFDGRELEKVGKKVGNYFFPDVKTVQEAFELIKSRDIPETVQISLVSYPFVKTISRSRKRPFHGYFNKATSILRAFCKAVKDEEVAEPITIRGDPKKTVYTAVRFDYLVEEVYESRKKLSKTEKGMLLHVLEHSGIYLVEGSIEYPEGEQDEQEEEEEDEDPEPVFSWDDDDDDYIDDEFMEFLIADPASIWYYQQLGAREDRFPDPVISQMIYYAHLLMNKEAVFDDLVFSISCQLSFILFTGFIILNLNPRNIFKDFVNNDLIGYLVLPSLSALMASYVNDKWQNLIFSQLEPQRLIIPKLISYYKPILEKMIEPEYYKKIVGRDIGIRYRESLDYFERYKRGELR